MRAEFEARLGAAERKVYALTKERDALRPGRRPPGLRQRPPQGEGRHHPAGTRLPSGPQCLGCCDRTIRNSVWHPHLKTLSERSRALERLALCGMLAGLARSGRDLVN